MKKILVLILILSCLQSFSQNKDAIEVYHLPDSVKAVQFLVELTPRIADDIKSGYGGVQTEAVKLYLSRDKTEKVFVFEIPENATFIAEGNNIRKEKTTAKFNYDWSISETYKLLISQATDSAGNFSLYSGYIFLPREDKWKFIGTTRINGRSSTIQEPATFQSTGKKKFAMYCNLLLVQRNNGSWKNLQESAFLPPQINLYGHMDSVWQRMQDTLALSTLFEKDFKYNQGVYYKILRYTDGKPIAVTDTVSVLYKLTLFNDTATIDEAKNEPVRFPLNRLIRGWQIGVPMINIGGKIRLILPSDLGYSVRTRSPKIPPNSILVFEIEVVDATKRSQ